MTGTRPCDSRDLLNDTRLDTWREIRSKSCDASSCSAAHSAMSSKHAAGYMRIKIGLPRPPRNQARLRECRIGRAVGGSVTSTAADRAGRGISSMRRMLTRYIHE